MKKAMLVIGIILIVLSVITLLLGALFNLSYRTLMDGSFDMYDRLHFTYTLCFILGSLMLVGGILLIVSRKRI